MSRLSSRTRNALIALVALVAILVGATGLVYAVYIRRSDAPIVRAVGGWLPAARIGNHYISYRDFLTSRDALRVYLASEAAKSAGLSGPVTPTVEKNSLDRLLREAAGNELAAERAVSVSEDDVRSAFTDLIDHTSSTVPNVAEYLNTTFHWNEEQFRSRVIRPALLEEHLAASFVSSTEEGGALNEGVTKLEQYFQERLARSDVKTYLRF